MSLSILEILDTEEKQLVVITAMEQYIKKCNTHANSNPRGYGSVVEIEKKKQWALKAEFAQSLLNDINIELTSIIPFFVFLPSNNIIPSFNWSTGTCT